MTAPVSSKVSILRMSACRLTVSRQRPLYCDFEIHESQNLLVSYKGDTVSATRWKFKGGSAIGLTSTSLSSSADVRTGSRLFRSLLIPFARVSWSTPSSLDFWSVGTFVCVSCSEGLVLVPAFGTSHSCFHLTKVSSAVTLYFLEGYSHIPRMSRPLPLEP